ncbi:hypothetical protein BGZ57DRAFT_459516 [Hyaloscypha finlandica]|nr:hypothetical protein BGZ57DRAFT_459516 [Hyaloscypha finlandica]
MADPFSIIGLVGASLKGILQAKEFIDTIQRAPRSIETLRDELSTIAGLLRELGHLADRTDELNLNRIIREPLANCDKVSKHIEKLIQPYVKISGGITKWGRFAFGFKESDVLLLQRDLSACKQNLALAITSADLITTRKVVRGMRRVQNHFGIPSSSVAESDIDERKHERIKEWVGETETIMEEEEPLDTAGERIQQPEPSRSRREQGEGSIELPDPNPPGRRSPRLVGHQQGDDSTEVPGPNSTGKRRPIPNSSTSAGGNEASAAHGTTENLKDNEAIALHTFYTQEHGGLAFYKGDVIVVTAKTSSTNDWWTGTIGARTGLFPASLVKMRTSSDINPRPPAQGSYRLFKKRKDGRRKEGTVSPPGKSITVQVKRGGSRGEILSIRIQKNYTIANVKTDIALRTGVPETRQRLYLKGCSLDNKSTLEQYGIKNGDVIGVTFDGFYSYRNE